MKYKNIIVCGMVAVMLAGCGSQKTLQEQVTENLLKAENVSGASSHEGEIVLTEEQISQEIEESVKEAAAGTEEEPEKKPEAEQQEQQEEAGSEQAAEPVSEPPDDSKVQIVFLGDSIFDTSRDGTGIPYLVGEQCDANIYNLAVGGSPAGLYKDEDAGYDNWVSIGMLGMINAITGHVDPDCFSKYHARKVFDTCDFSKTDYFVVEYGTNDFLSKIPVTNNSDNSNDPYSYYGAVQMGISELRMAFPDAEVIFVTPHYEQFWGRDNLWLGDCNTVNLGCGTLSDYIAAGYNAAASAGAVAINAYNDMGINSYTAEEYLEDGIHLTEAGRRAYAEVLARRINGMEINKAN